MTSDDVSMTPLSPVQSPYNQTATATVMELNASNAMASVMTHPLSPDDANMEVQVPVVSAPPGEGAGKVTVTPMYVDTVSRLPTPMDVDTSATSHSVTHYSIEQQPVRTPASMTTTLQTPAMAAKQKPTIIVTLAANGLPFTRLPSEIALQAPTVSGATAILTPAMQQVLAQQNGLGKFNAVSVGQQALPVGTNGAKPLVIQLTPHIGAQNRTILKQDWYNPRESHPLSSHGILTVVWSPFKVPFTPSTAPTMQLAAPVPTSASIRMPLPITKPATQAKVNTIPLCSHSTLFLFLVIYAPL